MKCILMITNRYKKFTRVLNAIVLGRAAGGEVKVMVVKNEDDGLLTE